MQALSTWTQLLVRGPCLMQKQICFTLWRMTFCAQVVATPPVVAPSAFVALALTLAGLLAMQRARARGQGKFQQKPQSSLQSEQLPGLTLVSQQSLPALGDCGSSLESGTFWWPFQVPFKSPLWKTFASHATSFFGHSSPHASLGLREKGP